MNFPLLTILLFVVPILITISVIVIIVTLTIRLKDRERVIRTLQEELIKSKEEFFLSKQKNEKLISQLKSKIAEQDRLLNAVPEKCTY